MNYHFQNSTKFREAILEMKHARRIMNSFHFTRKQNNTGSFKATWMRDVSINALLAETYLPSSLLINVLINCFGQIEV
jgi:hypothetical protein